MQSDDRSKCGKWKVGQNQSPGCDQMLGRDGETREDGQWLLRRIRTQSEPVEPKDEVLLSA